MAVRAHTGKGVNGLTLGDTIGRTPGAYGFIVSCNLPGYIHPADVISAAKLVMFRSSNIGINPLSNDWTSDAGVGPAKIQFSMVRGPC